MEYRHVQWGYTALPVILLSAVIVVPLTASDEESSTLLTAAVAAVMVAIVIVVLIFSRLEVVVHGGAVSATFGLGWPRKRIALSDIQAVRTVRNQWWQGWGIRKVPDGWMYNVWGLDAVELVFADDSVFRLGTNEPEELSAVLSLQVRP